MQSLVNYLQAKGYSSNQTWEETTELLTAFLQDPTIDRVMSFCNCLSRHHDINEAYQFFVEGGRTPAHYQYAKALTILKLLVDRRDCTDEEYLQIDYGQFQILDKVKEITPGADTRLSDLQDASIGRLYKNIIDQNFDGSSVKMQIALAVAKDRRLQNYQPETLKIFEIILQSAAIENSQKATVKLEMALALHHFKRYQEELVILEDLLQDPEAMPTVKAQAKEAKLYAFLKSGQEGSELLSCLDDFLADSHAIDEMSKAKATLHTSDYFFQRSEGRQVRDLYDRIIWSDLQADVKFLKAELLFTGCGDLEKDINQAKLLYEDVDTASVSESIRSTITKRLAEIAAVQQ